MKNMDECFSTDSVRDRQTNGLRWLIQKILQTHKDKPASIYQCGWELDGIYYYHASHTGARKSKAIFVKKSIHLK